MNKSSNPIIIIGYAFIFALQGISPGYCFSPTMPPRFDNFCEQVVGSWGVAIDSEIENVREVEEVMRSCGGAVQGIKEVSLIDDSTSIYHNRADDGFVFFDCGSYTQGPIQLKSDIEGPLPIPIMASLSFSTIPKSCVAFDCSVNSWQAQVRSIGAKSFESSDLEQTQTSQEFEIQWGKETVCRMASASQPWMLQRAKWASSLEGGILLDGKKKVNLNDLELRGWLYDWDMSKEGKAWESDGLDALLKEETSRIVKIVAACVNTGEAKSLLRCYDHKDMLKAIVLQEGQIKSSDC